MAQILGGLISYLLLAIYCHEEHNERVNINRVRELRIKIRNELAQMMAEISNSKVLNPATNRAAAGPPSNASP